MTSLINNIHIHPADDKALINGYLLDFHHVLDESLNLLKMDNLFNECINIINNQIMNKSTYNQKEYKYIEKIKNIFGDDAQYLKYLYSEGEITLIKILIDYIINKFNTSNNFKFVNIYLNSLVSGCCVIGLCLRVYTFPPTIRNKKPFDYCIFDNGYTQNSVKDENKLNLICQILKHFNINLILDFGRMD